MIYLKQSTAVTILVGPFVDEDDGKTAETALTITQADVRLSKNGGNMAQKGDATSFVHDEIGYYTCPLSTTDTGTLGILHVMVHESGALPVKTECMVVDAEWYDTMVLGTDALTADLSTTALAAILTEQMTEAYNTDGTDPTMAEALFVIMQRLVDFTIIGTTISVKGIDGTTEKLTLTLDDATTPTTSSRAT
jgi:hypothetical protein